MLRYRHYLIDVKTLALRGSAMWTTHFSIYRDLGSETTLVNSTEMANRCESELEAEKAGHIEAVRIIEINSKITASPSSLTFLQERTGDSE